MGINFTDIAVTDPVIASTFNDRLDELDTAIKFNSYAKTAAPTTGDDSADGYTVGSRWIDTTNDRAYMLVDATVGAAIWLEIGRANMRYNFPAPAFYIVFGSPSLSNLGARVPTWTFDAGAIELVGAAVAYQGWKLGSFIAMDAYWAMESATSGNVVIGARAMAVAAGEDMSGTGSESIVSSTEAVPGTAKLLKKTTFSLSVNYVPDDVVRFSFERNGTSGSDTATGDLHLVAAVLRFL